MTKPVTPPRALRSTLWLATALLTLQLTGCGGGDGAPADQIPASADLKGRLLSGTGVNISDWDANSCGGTRQKNWLRAKLNEDYLFYSQAPLREIDPTTYSDSVVELFYDYTRYGVPDAQDRFSFVITQAEADGTFVEGATSGAGLGLARDAQGNIRIAYIEPTSPAAQATGLRRGQILQAVDGETLGRNAIGLPTLTEAQFNALFASTPGTGVRITVASASDGSTSTVDLVTAKFSETPVHTAKLLSSQVGYLLHNSYSIPAAETQLADAFKTFATAGITDLVVDLRYNTGGYLFIASQMAYMVAGASRTSGKVFEALRFNDKRTRDNSSDPFLGQLTTFLDPTSARAGEALPALSLNRVYVLTSGSTCSASEAFINGLRGVDVEVVLVGGTTCGKPYGFIQKDNCALSYFAIDFVGQNHKGVAVPTTGLTASCTVTDDFAHELGDPAEQMLATALQHATQGSCPSVAAASLRSSTAAAAVAGEFSLPHRNIQLRLTR